MTGFDSYRVRERADIARWVLVGAFLVLSGAFFRTQIIQHDKFQLKAETNRLRPIALTPAKFGAGALAHTVVGYLASWARAMFFADNALVNAGFIAVGLWMRDLLVLAASGSGDRSFLAELALYSPLQALTTALFALVVLLAFREWFSIRLDA